MRPLQPRRQTVPAPLQGTPGNTKERLSYIDGLRGIAVFMVLFHHAAFRDMIRPVPPPSMSALRIVLDVISLQAFEGVSLFLVLSGFCLSYPLLKRRREGHDHWFRPSEFFARRCLRILPPYYVALALSILLILALPAHRSRFLLFSQGPGIGAPNILSHILLIHNLTPWYASINGPFWSLGLEWQWYLVFPIILLLAVRSSALAVGACVISAVGWHVGTHDMFQLYPYVSGALPARLCEFCCGIVAAQVVLGSRHLSASQRSLLVTAACLPLLVAALPPLTHASESLFGQAQPQPLYGIAFAALVVLGHSSPNLRAALSWRPLVGLGICSYSVYLVHLPIQQMTEAYAPSSLQSWPTILLITLASALPVGVLFHWLVERPCMSHGTWTACSPILIRSFAWTDRLVSMRLPAPPRRRMPARFRTIPQTGQTLAIRPAHLEDGEQ